MSEYKYPYFEEAAGIDMAKILIPGFHATVKAGSGRELAVDVRERSIEIRDIIKPHYHLQALFDHHDSSLSFGLYTKVKRKDRGEILTTRGRHPDFFAKHFITSALEFFSRNGLKIEQCRGNWVQGEENYREFIRLYELGYDPVDCAKKTWAGQQFMLNGFGQISRENIYPLEMTDKPASVRASFYRY